MKHFQDAFEQTGAELYMASSEDGLRTKLKRYIQAHDIATICVADQEIVHSVLEGIHGERIEEPINAGCSITSADYLISETGTIGILTSKECTRAHIFGSPIHIVIARTTQVCLDLSTCLEDVQEREADFSSMTLITGPSRTADIEKMLIVGVHGPAELALFLLES